MAALIGMPRAVWRRQPSSGDIWHNSPFLEKLTSFWSDQDELKRSRGLVNNPIGLNTAILHRNTPYGRGIGFTGGAGSCTSDATLVMPANMADNQTWVCLTYPRSSAFSVVLGAPRLAGYFRIDSGTNWSCAITSSSWRIEDFVSLGPLKIDRLNLVSVTKNATSKTVGTTSIDYSVVSGISEGSTGAENPPSIRLGGYDDGLSYNYNGDVFYFFHLNKQIDESYTRELGKNPWQLFKPRIIRFISIPSGVAIPTLSSPTAINITSSGFQPRVTATY